ncbi:tRNA 2-thiouridine(34) synthase MnmA, partial [Patescibacteria group bacterium]|nr:tRNA 2-thiouridine(34) synthase MnmA [Patescibacteria group bacterium]
MSESKQKQIVVGMSGGIDSSMALVLLKKQGWQPIGVSLKYAVWQDKKNLLRENVCCSTQSFKIARDVCQKLKVPHYIFDVSAEFKKQVIDYFIKELKNKKTPNPCIVCNRYLKFEKLFKWAKEHNIQYVATGHYARLRREIPNSKSQIPKYQLLRAKDKEKDQTYSLSFLPQKWLKNIVFPLGDYTKPEIYKIAKKYKFDVFLKQKESQDFCFVAGKSMKCFLEKEIGTKTGLIKDKKGNILGKHQGLHFYTIGQRKGINLPGGPYFVLKIDKRKNILIVTKDEKKLCQKQVFVSHCHFTSGTPPQKKIQVQAKIRYRQELSRATLTPISKTKIKLVFNKPQRA